MAIDLVLSKPDAERDSPVILAYGHGPHNDYPRIAYKECPGDRPDRFRHAITTDPAPYAYADPDSAASLGGRDTEAGADSVVPDPDMDASANMDRAPDVCTDDIGCGCGCDTARWG